jgi:1-acyl-sn-glycerol-3-phosphate acyltransferase
MATAFYITAQAACTLFFRLFYDYEITGEEHIPEGGCLLASNHESFFDPPLVGCTLACRPHYLARKTLFDHPWFGATIRALQAHPIDQERPDMAGLKRIISVARAGGAVLIFPEGSRSWDGRLQPAQPGVGLVVAKARVPVVPIRIFGAHQAWPRGGRPRLFRRIRVVIAPPIYFPDVPATREAYQEIGDKIMAAIAAIPEPLA